MINQWPTLKIKSSDGDSITADITLNGNTITGLQGIEVSARLPGNNMFAIKLEILASLDIEISANVQTENVVYFGGQKFKLVSCNK